MGVPARSNFGFEFALGNSPSNSGRGWGGSHPSGNPNEFIKYRQMGEIAYIQSRQKQAINFVRNSPMEFIILTKRVSYFWDGSDMDLLSPSIGIGCLPVSLSYRFC